MLVWKWTIFRNEVLFLFDIIKELVVSFKIKSHYTPCVIPAEAGIQGTVIFIKAVTQIIAVLDSRLRGNDEAELPKKHRSVNPSLCCYRAELFYQV